MTAALCVETLAPVRGGGRPGMGLSRIAEADWLDRSDALAARVAAKRAILDAEPDCVAMLPGAEDAVAELAALLGCAPDLRTCALQTYEDLLLLRPGAGGYELVAAALAFPTDWSLRAKMGRCLSVIHAPMPTYTPNLSAGVDHMFATLPPDRLLARANWNVLETDALRYLPAVPARERYGGVTAANAGERLFVRVERQVTRRLPRSGAMLFTIGIYAAPLGSLSPGLVTDLVAAVAKLPAVEAERKGVAAFGEALSGYAAKQVSAGPA